MNTSTKKKLKSTVIVKGETSLFIYLIPMIMTLLTLYYGFKLNKLNTFITLTLVLLYQIYPTINYYKKKLVVTNNKIYFYYLGKSSYSCHYLQDFGQLYYEQDRLGKIFNYGTLILVNQQNKFYQYNYLHNPAEIYEKIVLTYEDYISMKDPTYEKTYNTNNKNKLDSIDNLEKETIKNDK